MIGIKQAWKNYWKQYVGFKGQATRAEYWWMTLINGVIALIFGWIPLAVIGIRIYVQKNSFREVLLWLIVVGVVVLYKLATIIPDLALNARRWQDAGFRLWHWLVLGLIVPGIVYALSSITDNKGGIVNDIANSLLILVGLLSFVISVLPSKNRRG